MTNTYLELLTYFIVYSFLGWGIEVAIIAIKDKRFRNRGFVNLPFCIMYGAMMDVLIVLWPNLTNHPVFKFIAAFVVFVTIQAIAEYISTRICKRMLLKYEDITPYNGQWMNLVVAVLFGIGLWGIMELVHPFNYMLVQLLPGIVLKIFCGIVGGVIFLDFLLTLYIMYKNRGNRKVSEYQQMQQEYQSNLNSRIYERIWNRLDKAYPNIEDEPEVEEKYVFAKGICLDKIIWVFLVSALLGDFIETIYCWAVGGTWMSRSSVLYGPFSIVWGIGAVVLTIVLSKFAEKPDRYIFLIGALIGGVYEYGCSLFTEIFLGTVFWDYSWMPFNIGGRTNLLYMGFWGILSVVWIKLIYPKMSYFIEKLPALQGKVITWVLVVFMICNAFISAMAMVRYTQRQEGVEAENAMEIFLDANYEDALIEKVWPNMVITK
ncbi:MAG: putative ABC transporter permease [Agathobacter sp.]|nr:putative ABC transporter permease [Agathobacter sp.]